MNNVLEEEGTVGWRPFRRRVWECRRWGGDLEDELRLLHLIVRDRALNGVECCWN